MINAGEVWATNFPLEEDPTRTLPRPVIVLDVNSISMKVLSVKITKTEPRDQYDTLIVYWKEAKLKLKSTARTSQVISLDQSYFHHKIGDLHSADLKIIQALYIQFLTDKGII